MQTVTIKKLQQKWYQKLKKEGFEDIETTIGNKSYLKLWHCSYFQTKYSSDTFTQTQRYYAAALEFLSHHAFSSEIDQKIWALYAEGKTYREIAAILMKNVATVHSVVKRLKKEMFIETGIHG